MLLHPVHAYAGQPRDLVEGARLVVVEAGEYAVADGTAAGDAVGVRRGGTTVGAGLGSPADAHDEAAAAHGGEVAGGGGDGSGDVGSDGFCLARLGEESEDGVADRLRAQARWSGRWREG